jgi:hypothetical protein
VIYPTIGNFTYSKKKHYFGGQKGENEPSEPNLGPKQYGRVIYRSGILHGVRKNILLGVKKAKISLQSPKTEFEAKISLIV